jgi:hypothetical protein
MRLPGAERAFVDLFKLTGYVLNPMHPLGKHKARVLASALGITQANAGLLRNLLLDAAMTNVAVLGAGDEYGQRYVVDFECSRQISVRLFEASG